MNTLTVSIILAGYALSSVHGGQALAAQPEANAHVTLAGIDGSSVSGSLELKSTPEGVHITGSISGLAPDSRHGFHVHENGECSAPGAKSAGGHFDPGHDAHGNPQSIPHHAGDIPNLDVNSKGTAVVDVTVEGVDLGNGPESILNRAVIVHAKADDYSTQPAGDSGSRIACGVISSRK